MEQRAPWEPASSENLAINELKKFAKVSDFQSLHNWSIENKESLTLQLDSSLANSILGWEPTWIQKDAIVSTVQWWKKILLDKEDPLSACQSDIETLLKK